MREIKYKTARIYADRIRDAAFKLKTVQQELEELADDIEAAVMKKTTQRSPEWYGGANC